MTNHTTNPEIIDALREGLRRDHLGDLPQLHITCARPQVIDKVKAAAPAMPQLGLTVVGSGFHSGAHGVLLRPAHDFDLALDPDVRVRLYYKPEFVLSGDDDLDNPEWAFCNFPAEAQVENYLQAGNYAPTAYRESLYCASCMLGREGNVLLRSALLRADTQAVPGKTQWTYRARVNNLHVTEAPKVYIEHLYEALLHHDQDIKRGVAV